MESKNVKRLLGHLARILFGAALCAMLGESWLYGESTTIIEHFSIYFDDGSRSSLSAHDTLLSFNTCGGNLACWYKSSSEMTRGNILPG